MSFPLRQTRSSLGPTMEDARPCTNPKRHIPAATFNSLFWSVSGMGLLSPVAGVWCTVSAGVLTLDAHAEAWNPDQTLAGPTPVRSSAGVYTFEYLSTYPDEQGVEQALALVSGAAFATGLGTGGNPVVPHVTRVTAKKMQVNLFELVANAAADASFFAFFW